MPYFTLAEAIGELNMISQIELKRILNYDANTGIFTRLIANRHLKIGSVPGYKNKLGYVVIKIMGDRYLSHRLAWIYVYGVIPNKFIDHINGNPSDNRIVNLREASHAQNMQNQLKPQKNNSSGYLGVYLQKNSNKYRADIKLNGKTIHLGVFDTAELASKAYLEKKSKIHQFTA